MPPTSPTPPLYLISGLGGDERLFEKMGEFGLQYEFLPYIRPHKKESLREYARRIAEPIDRDRPFVVGGVSFGGILAVEIAKILNPEKVMLISSVKTSREFPFYFKLFRYLPVQKLISGESFIRHAPKEMFPKGSRFAEIQNGMFADADPVLIKWAIDKVVYWRNREIPENVVHIHGDKDRLFPKRFIKDKVLIPGGTHVMVLTEARAVVEAIRKELGHRNPG